VNQKLFRGFATTAAVREGYLEILDILLRAGASQPACEEAVLEASCHGHARLVELLMGSDLIRPHIAVRAFVTACCSGFVDVVDTLMKVKLCIHIGLLIANFLDITVDHCRKTEMSIIWCFFHVIFLIFFLDTR